jgi:hypothetical protein
MFQHPVLLVGGSGRVRAAGEGSRCNLATLRQAFRAVQLGKAPGDAAYPSSGIRPASVMRISSTMSVTPGRPVMGSVTTVASLASTRLESISTEKPCAKRKLLGQTARGTGKLFEGSALFATETTRRGCRRPLASGSDHTITESWLPPSWLAPRGGAISVHSSSTGHTALDSRREFERPRPSESGSRVARAASAQPWDDAPNPQ